MKRMILALVCALTLGATAAAADGYYDGDGYYVLTDGGNVFYQSHLQNVGDVPPLWDGRTTGTTGEARRLEALRVYGAAVEYRVHVQGIGWTGWVMDEWAGTKGRSLRLEAVEIRTSHGADPADHVQYRAHVQNIGWTPWVMDGELAGTTGKGLRIEAVEVRIVREVTE